MQCTQSQPRFRLTGQIESGFEHAQIIAALYRGGISRHGISGASHHGRAWRCQPSSAGDQAGLEPGLTHERYLRGTSKLVAPPNWKETSMHWNVIEGNWKHYKGQLKDKWSNLKHDDLEKITGRREQLEDLIQHHCGMDKDAVREQIDNWVKTLGRPPGPDT